MIKLRIEVFRRNQRRYDEIEQMASRPFASVRLELTSPRANLVSNQCGQIYAFFDFQYLHSEEEVESRSVS